jgi:predicted GNAT family acetyltransferase
MNTEVHDNPTQLRYDIIVDGKPAGFARYVRKGNRIIFVHTEVDDAYEGHGLGSRLAQGALDDARARGLAVVPLCPFIERYIQKHPEYEDLVDHEALAALEA